ETNSRKRRVRPNSSLVPPPAHQATRTHEQKNKKQAEREGHRMLRSEPIRAEALDNAEHHSAQHRPRHAPTPAQNANHERLAEKQRAVQRRNRKDNAEQRA